VDLITFSKVKKAVSIAPNNKFSNDAERDAYFTANPTELKNNMYIFNADKLQQYSNSTWHDATPAIKGDKGERGAQGTKGDKGDKGDPSTDPISAENITLNKEEFAEILKDYTGDDIQSLLNYIDKVNELPGGIIYIGEKDEINSWEIKKVGQGLAFSRFQDGSYDLIYTIENSATTDNYFINCPEGRLAYITEDKKIHTLIKSSTDLQGCQLNNIDGRISLIHNGTVASYSPIGSKTKVDINKITEEEGIAEAQFVQSYTQEVVISENLLLFGVNEYYVVECEPNTTARLYITDKATGNLLAQNCSVGQFYGGKGKLVTVGINTIDFSEALPILEGRDVLLHADFTDVVCVQGKFKGEGADNRFYIRFNTFVQPLKEENMATKEWVDDDVHKGFKVVGDHPQLCYTGSGKVNEKVINLIMNSSDSETIVGNLEYKTIVQSPSGKLISRRNKGLNNIILQPIKNTIVKGGDYSFPLENKTQGKIVIDSIELVVAKSCTASFYIYSADPVVLKMDAGDFTINNNCIQAFDVGESLNMYLTSNDDVDYLMGDGTNPYVKINYFMLEDGEIFNSSNLIGGTNISIDKVDDNFVINSSGVSSEWDMNVDLSKSENIKVISQGDIKYTHFHDIPFERNSEWVANEYIEIANHIPHEDISVCTYFTLKGREPYKENYTDLTSKFRLRIEKEDGIVNIDCVASTGIPDIYNKIEIPIPMTAKVGLWCNCLSNPNGYLPNNEFTIGFYTSTGIESVTTPLFDAKTGLVNENILPTSGGNKFNEIKLYDVPDASAKNGVKNPAILYDSENFGYTSILSANSGRGMGITLGNIMSEFDIMTNAKEGLRTWYFSKSAEIGIGEEPSSDPMEGTSWTRKFSTQKDVDSIVGFVFLAGAGTKVNLKVHSMLNQGLILEKEFSFDKITEPASPAYAIVSDGTSGFDTVNQGDYEIEVTLLSGSLYGADFPYCTLVMGKLTSDTIAHNSTLESQAMLKTKVDSFIIDENATNKISKFEDHNDVYCDKIVIPKISSNKMAINIIGDNVFEYSSLSGKPVYVYADLSEVGVGNFRDESGNQVDIYISPNNISTWKVFESMGYKITPIELPIATTKQSILTNDENGVIDWTVNPLRDGCIYLSAKNRIKSIEGQGFIFEVFLANNEWHEVTRFEI